MKRYTDKEIDEMDSYITSSETRSNHIMIELQMRQIDLLHEILDRLPEKVVPVIREAHSDRFADLDINDIDDHTG